jgi:heavy metal sensor kinase
MPFAPTKMIRSSISLRIALLFSATFTVGLCLAFLFTYVQLQYSLEKTSKDVISAKLREVSAVLKNQNIADLEKFLSDDKNRILNAPFMIRLISSDGKPVYLKPSIQKKHFDFEGSFRAETNAESLLGWHALSAINDEDKFDILTEKIGLSLYLQVGKSSEDREKVLGHVLRGFEITGTLFILLSAIFGVWYSRKSLAPIRDLLAATRRIEKGDLTHRVPLNKSPDELRELGETFNHMVERIESLIRGMRESIDNVAHDIRTPLTRIRAVSESALLSKDESSLREALEDCAESAVNLSELIDQLMSISEADAGTLTLRFENCDVAALLKDVSEIYEFVALEKQIKVITRVDAEFYWELDRKKIKQVVGNLLDNALKFSPAGTTILLSGTKESGGLKISVRDQGHGVTETELDRVWERLFRGDKSRTTKGSGLGLSIVRSIVKAHGGHAEAKPNPDGGMTFSISLPSPFPA